MYQKPKSKKMRTMSYLALSPRAVRTATYLYLSNTQLSHQGRQAGVVRVCCVCVHYEYHLPTRENCCKHCKRNVNF